MKSLHDLIQEERKKNKEKFLKSTDKNINYYYEEKKKRISEGKEEIYIFPYCGYDLDQE